MDGQRFDGSRQGHTCPLASLRRTGGAVALVFAWCLLASGQEAPDDNPPPTAPLVLPESLTLTVRHPLGPLAGFATRPFTSQPLPFEIAYRGQLALENVSLSTTFLSRAGSGAASDAQLYLAGDADDAVPSTRLSLAVLPEGRPVRLRLLAKGVLTPGRYTGQVLIAPAGREERAVIPVNLVVAAHPAWPLGCLVAGLATLGLLGFFAGAASVQEEQIEVLTLRQAFHELAGRGALPESSRALADEIGDLLARALSTLAQRRSWELKDRRLTAASQLRVRAGERLALLRAKLEEAAPGTPEVRELEGQWQRYAASANLLREQLDQLHAQLPTEDTLGAGLAAALRGLRRLLIDELLTTFDNALAPHVARAGLSLVSGQGEDARALAVEVSRWLRRAARLVEQRAGQLLGWHSFIREMLAADDALRADSQDAALPEDVRCTLREQLDGARRALEPDPTPAGLQLCHRILQEAATLALRGRADVMLAAARHAMQTAAAQTALDPIQQALSELAPGDPPPLKRQRLLGILEMIDQHVERCQDEPLRADFHRQVADLQRLAAAGDFPALGAPFQAFLQRWDTYEQAHLDCARRSVVDPFCAAVRPALGEGLRRSQERLRLLQPQPGLEGLDEELDRIRLRLETMSPSDCLGELTDLFGRLLAVDNRLFTVLLDVAEITPQARLTAAETSQVQEAIRLARRLMAEARPLRVAVRSDQTHWYAGSQISFEVGGLDPAWGAGTSVIVDFGDGSAPQRRTAEQLREQPVLVHRYEQAKRCAVQVTAAERFQDDGRTAEGEVLGHGTANLTIDPSPISRASELAGVFLNLRFVVALIIAVGVETWRMGGGQPFGINAQDYVEAFAMGVGIDSGLRGLVTLIR